MVLMRLLSICVGFSMACSAAFAVSSLGVHGPSRIGVKTDRPFLYLVPSTGTGSLKFSATGLPNGLTLDSATGIISGSSSAEGSFPVRFIVQDSGGASAYKDVEVVVGQKAMALTPVMGWNPWYVWGCTVDDSKIRQAADLMVSSGLAAHGYNYINLDDCWAGKRDAVTGEMQPNSRFPDMTALVNYVHAKGLRIGIYTSPGAKTCAGYPATMDHNFDVPGEKSYLETDVATYARWGFDFIKYDWCMFPKDQKIKDQYYAKQNAIYQRMSDVLDKAPRAMVHMVCQYGERAVWTWAQAVGGNMWRTNNDLADEWAAVVLNGFENLKLSQFAGPGHWNDLDMLMVGKANWPAHLGQYTIPADPPRPTKLTPEEQLTHISLWSLMASPMLFSGDLSQLDPQTIAMLTNDDVVDINQDALGAPVTVVSDVGGARVLSRRLADGSIAVGLFNMNTAATRVSVDFQVLGMSGFSRVKVRNLWRGIEMYAAKGIRADVAPHGVALVKLTPEITP